MKHATENEDKKTIARPLPPLERGWAHGFAYQALDRLGCEGAGVYDGGFVATDDNCQRCDEHHVLASHLGLIAEAEIRISDEYPAVKWLSDVTRAGSLAFCSKRWRADHDMQIGLLLIKCN
jgi:hypothetical protein